MTAQEQLTQISEIQVLAHILNDNTNYTLYSNRLHPNLFNLPLHFSIFNVSVLIINNGDIADMISVAAKLNIQTAFDDLQKIVSQIDFNNNIESHIDFLNENFKRNKLTSATAKLHNSLMSYMSMNDIENVVNNEINNVFLDNTDEKPKHISEHLTKFQVYLANNKEKKELTGIGTGISYFDKFSGGLQPSDLVIVAGRTSHGKTSLALTIANNADMYYHKKVAILSLEMNEIQLISRIIAQRTGISSKRILIDKLEQFETNEINNSIKQLSNSNIYLDDCKSTQLNYLVNQMTYLVITKKIDLFVVDYLQLVNHNLQGGNTEQKTAFIARKFKNFAKENNTTVILLSQCNRSDRNKSKPPSLSDLRDSGQIEEAADIVMFTWMPFTDDILTFPDDSTSTDGRSQIIIAKGRNIGLAKFYLEFNKQTTKFSTEEQPKKISDEQPF